MDILQVIIGIAGIIIAILITWVFYKKGNTQTKKMEEEISNDNEKRVNKLLGDIATLLREMAIKPASESPKENITEQKAFNEPKNGDIDKLQETKEIVQLVLSAYKEGEIFIPELIIIARSLSTAGEKLNKLLEIRNGIGLDYAHGKVVEAGLKEDEFRKKLNELLE